MDRHHRHRTAQPRNAPAFDTQKPESAACSGSFISAPNPATSCSTASPAPAPRCRGAQDGPPLGDSGDPSEHGGRVHRTPPGEGGQGRRPGGITKAIDGLAEADSARSTVGPSMYEVTPSGCCSRLGDERTVRARCRGQLGFEWQADGAPFCGIRGRMRLAVLDGAVGPRRSARSSPRSARRSGSPSWPSMCCPVPRRLLAELSKGSRIRKAPRDSAHRGLRSVPRRRTEGAPREHPLRRGPGRQVSIHPGPARPEPGGTRPLARALDEASPAQSWSPTSPPASARPTSPAACSTTCTSPGCATSSS